MNLKKIGIFLLPVSLVFIVLLVIINRAPASTGSSKIKVVAVENVYGDIVKQIGKDRLDVYSILSNPNLDPHEYESTFNDTNQIKTSKLVIENGIGYDTFVDKILTSINETNIKVINLGSEEGLSDSDNPHLWYNISYVKDLALNIKNNLSLIDPSNKDYYTANYNEFINSIYSTLNLQCYAIQDKYNGVKFISTERVADYLLQSCGLTAIKNDFQKSIEDGNDPSVDSIQKFKDALTNHTAKLLIYNDQTISNTTEEIKKLAKDNNVPIIGVSESMPLDKNYQGWMSDELNDIFNKLNNK